MKKETYSLNIPRPCHEKWNDMTPNERGRFCNHCSKTIIDFTKMSDKEIISVLTHQPNVCGRFRNEQMNRPIALSESTVIHSYFPLRNIVFGLFILTTPLVVFSQTDTTKTEIHAPSEILIVEENAKTGTDTVEGWLIDAETDEPLPYQKVHLNGVDYSTIASTFSDESGYFKLVIPPTYKQDTVIVEFDAYFMRLNRTTDLSIQHKLYLQQTESLPIVGLVFLTKSELRKIKRKERKNKPGRSID